MSETRASAPPTPVVVVIGAGDLGRRILAGLISSCDDGLQYHLWGRRPEHVEQVAHLLESCHGQTIHSDAFDARHVPALQVRLNALQPALIVQCASLLSPWALAERRDERSMRVLAAGFAAQLCAQLPIAQSVMRAVSGASPNTMVVNCSYPDVVNPILAAIGLPPALGVGNAGMIHAIAEANIARGRSRSTTPALRVLAHHAHVTPVVTSDRTRLGSTAGPRVFLGPDGARIDDIVWAGPALPNTRELNQLTASHATSVIRALLGYGALQTSAPGVSGLTGGVPVRIDKGQVELDLPPGETLASAEAFLREAASLDGLAALGTDGTAYFTAKARSALGDTLLHPMHPNEAWERYCLLRRYLELEA